MSYTLRVNDGIRSYQREYEAVPLVRAALMDAIRTHGRGKVSVYGPIDAATIIEGTKYAVVADRYNEEVKIAYGKAGVQEKVEEFLKDDPDLLDSIELFVQVPFKVTRKIEVEL